MASNNLTLVNRSAEEVNMLHLVFRIESVLIPILVAIGVVGSIISAIVFFQPNLRKVSCSFYLGARALSDIGFLLCLFVMWLHNMRVDVFAIPGVCHVQIFLSYLCAFLSVWFVVWVSVENYYRICRPFKVTTFCTVKIAKIVISVTLLLGCGFYCVSFLTPSTVIRRGITSCSIVFEYRLVNTILSYADTVITLVVPSVIIILATGRILYSLILTCKKDSAQAKKGSGTLQTKVTRLLFFVSFTFLVLNLPSHTIRIKLDVESWIGYTSKLTPANYFLHHLLQQIYYLSFSVNFFLYVSLGESFRQTCLQLFCKPLQNAMSKKRSENPAGSSKNETSARLLSVKSSADNDREK